MTRTLFIFLSLFFAILSQYTIVYASPLTTPQECDLKFQSLENKNWPELRALVRRAFDKNIDPEDQEPKRDSTGFLVQTEPKNLVYWRHPFMSIKQLIPRTWTKARWGTKYDLDIVGGVNYHYGNYTEKRGQRKQLTLFSVILGSYIIALPTLPLQARVFVYGEHKGVEAYVDARIYYDWDKWGERVKYDYRNHVANRELKEGDISPLGAREEAYRNKQIYDDYVKYLKDKTTSKDYAHKKAIYENSALFSHVETLKQFMLGDKAAFFAIRPGPMTDEQEAKVFKLDEDLASNYEVVASWTNMGAPRNLNGLPKTFKDRMSSILNDKSGFAQNLLDLRDDRQITNLELQFLLQRDLSDQHDYATQELLGLVPYRFENGAFTDQLDYGTLEELRDGTLKNVTDDLKTSL